MHDIAVVSVKIKPEIPDQYRQHFKISDSSELILGGSAGPTVAFQDLKLVACDQNTPLNSEIVLHFCIQSDFKTPHLELRVNVCDDQARDAEEKTLQNSMSQLKKQADICQNEITVCMIVFKMFYLMSFFADLSRFRD